MDSFHFLAMMRRHVSFVFYVLFLSSFLPNSLGQFAAAAQVAVKGAAVAGSEHRQAEGAAASSEPVQAADVTTELVNQAEAVDAMAASQAVDAELADAVDATAAADAMAVNGTAANSTAANGTAANGTAANATASRAASSAASPSSSASSSASAVEVPSVESLLEELEGGKRESMSKDLLNDGMAPLEKKLQVLFLYNIFACFWASLAWMMSLLPCSKIVHG